MKIYRIGIHILDFLVNVIISLFLLLVLFYGIYAIWDSNQMYKQAGSGQFETYKPTSKDTLSFEALKKINSEVFGWITIKGTNIDYPLVQASNNSKYVNTDVLGKFSLTGSIFLDSRNKKDFSDLNSIIYGHNLEKKVMFGGVKEFGNKDYFERHKYGELFYDDTWHKVEFFAFLRVDAYDSIIYDTGLQGVENTKKYLNYIEKNAMQFNAFDFQHEEHFITLSTCTSTSTNGRHILVGRIIP